MKKKTICKGVDCNLCTLADTSSLLFRRFPKGTHFPAEKRIKNCIILVQKGELLINSSEYPGTILKSMDMVLQGIGSKLELLALTDVEYYIYWFTEMDDLICKEHYDTILENATEPLVYTPLKALPPINHLFTDLTAYINRNKIPCARFLDMKAREFIFLLTTLYPMHQISSFFYPISIYTESFYYFVMQNYEKVKNVEDNNTALPSVNQFPVDIKDQFSFLSRKCNMHPFTGPMILRTDHFHLIAAGLTGSVRNGFIRYLIPP